VGIEAEASAYGVKAEASTCGGEGK